MRPLSTLRDYSLALRAALKECANHPTPKHVHKLRTYTRRVEAMIKLLPRIAQLPAATHEAVHFLKTARPIRRAAGAVRDMDVLLAMLARLPRSAKEEFPAGIAHLTVKLERQRQRDADRLTRLIDDRGEKLLHAQDALETALAAARDVSTASAEIDRIARKLFRHATAHSTPRSLAASADALHNLRKSAKLTRYLAEANGGSPRSKTAQTAKRFHAVQEKIGVWHDWLLLIEFARKHLKAHHPLLDVLEKHEQRAHATAVRQARKLL
jgi:CHAD domain-containing protein